MHTKLHGQGHGISYLGPHPGPIRGSLAIDRKHCQELDRGSIMSLHDVVHMFDGGHEMSFMVDINALLFSQLEESG